jgi:hypothetical protein
LVVTVDDGSILNDGGADVEGDDASFVIVTLILVITILLLLGVLLVSSKVPFAAFNSASASSLDDTNVLIVVDNGDNGAAAIHTTRLARVRLSRAPLHLSNNQQRCI